MPALVALDDLFPGGAPLVGLDLTMKCQPCERGREVVKRRGLTRPPKRRIGSSQTHAQATLPKRRKECQGIPSLNLLYGDDHIGGQGSIPFLIKGTMPTNHHLNKSQGIATDSSMPKKTKLAAGSRAKDQLQSVRLVLSKPRLQGRLGLTSPSKTDRPHLQESWKHRKNTMDSNAKSHGLPLRVKVVSQRVHDPAGKSPSLLCSDAGGHDFLSLMPSRRPCVPRTVSGADVSEEFLGSTAETTAAHLTRHQGEGIDGSMCGRCCFAKYGAAWCRGHGTVTHRLGGKLQRIQWLRERKQGGAWGLGCAVCSHFLLRLAAEGGVHGTRAKRKFSTSMGRFEIRKRSSMQASCFQQHALTSVHHLALNAFLSPALPIVEFLRVSPDDSHLFSGAVPRASDWLRGWRSLRTPISFTAATKLFETEHYMQPARAMSITRHSLVALTRVMAEVIRARKREHLRNAYAITLVSDDRNGYKVVRFRCDHQTGVQSGILAVMHKGLEEVEHFDEDISTRACEHIMLAIKTLCTPLKGQCEDGLKEHILHHVRAYVSDGDAGALKVGRLLKERYMPNIVLLLRDPCHAIRIATRDPLHAETEFKKHWDDLYDNKHALIPDIQNSEVWRRKLQACQARVCEQDGSQGGGLKTILRHFSFAKQRYESCAAPQRKYCCMINAIALLLSMIAGDARQKHDVRERAGQALDSMTPKSIATAGLTADYNSVCMDFIRIFDTDDHDPALTARQRDEFINTMRTLFLRGYVALQPPARVGDVDPPMTMTQIAMSQIEEMRVFEYGNKRKVLWNNGAAPCLKELVARMHVVVDAMISRVQAELFDADLALSLQVFDMARWCDDNVSVAAHLLLFKQVRGLFRALGLPPQEGQQEFSNAVDPLLAERNRYRALNDGQLMDNRLLWSKWLDPTFRGDVVSEHLPKLIRFYISLSDGTGGVERALGTLANIIGKHSGPLDADGITTWDLVEVNLDGPKQEADIFVAAGEAHFEATEFGRQCQSTYVSAFGKRFMRNTKRRSDLGKQHSGGIPRVGTDKAIQERRRLAVSRLITKATERPRGDELTITGETLKSIEQKAGQSLTQSSHWNDRLARFHKATMKKRQAKQEVQRLREGNGRWCQVGNLKKGGIGRELLPPAPVPVANGTRVNVFLLTRRNAGTFSFAQHHNVLSTNTSAAKTAEVIIVDNVSDLDIQLDAKFLAVLAYVVGMGKSIIAACRWHPPTFERSSHVITHLRSASYKPVSFTIGAGVLKHGHITSALRACCSMTDSKWSCSLAGSAQGNSSSNAIVLNSLLDVQRFLLRQRDIQRRQCLGGTYARRELQGACDGLTSHAAMD